MTSIVAKYQPKAIADFIGITEPKAALGALARQPYASAWLLTGPPGLGKTTVTRGELRAVKHFRELRERPQLSLDLPIEPPYDPRRHPYIVTHIARKDGAGFVEDNSGILIYFDVRGDL